MSDIPTGGSTARLRLAVLVSGRGTNLQAILDGCARGDIPASVEIVLSNRPGVPALDRAAASGVPGVCVNHKDFGRWPESKPEYEKRVAQVLREYRVDLVVLAGYDRLAGPVLMEAYPGRIINIHPALLPSFPGLDAQRDALQYGAKVSGATVFFVDSSLDGGPIIVQEAVNILEDDTEESLAARILEVEHRILPRAITLIAEGRTVIEGRRVRLIL